MWLTLRSSAPILFSMKAASSYRTDLAYIHACGFASHATHASRQLIEQLAKLGIRTGRVVDLGCGSGVLAGHMAGRGYDVHGIDISKAMIQLARKRVPSARFSVGSFLDAEIPSCVAVTAMGECFNYVFDPRNSVSRLRSVFRRIFRSLQPGGLLLFDIATPARIASKASVSGRIESHDWTVLVTSKKLPGGEVLVRQITTFRKVGKLYRRDSETHKLLLLDAKSIARLLSEIGFSVRLVHSYSGMPLLPGVVGFLARKPGS